MNHYKTYSGRFITTFQGIFFWLMLAFFFKPMFDHGATIGLDIVMLLFLCWFIFLNSRVTYYFKIGQDSFMVCNHLLFGKKEYLISDIEEIIFETRPRMPNCLRIKLRGQKSKLYPAGTLRDKTWWEVKKDLEALGVTVINKNELIKLT